MAFTYVLITTEMNTLKQSEGIYNWVWNSVKEVGGGGRGLSPGLLDQQPVIPSIIKT